MYRFPIVTVVHRAEELELLVAGTPQLNMDDLAKVTKYEGGYGPDHPTIQNFWEVVKGMNLEDQRQLLMFATGSKKVLVLVLSKRMQWC
ncbi:unnamed protein product [Choristocarpus tenellus]